MRARLRRLTHRHRRASDRTSRAQRGCRVEEMRIGSALSTDPDPAKAAAAAADEAGSQSTGPRLRWPWSSAPGTRDFHAAADLSGS